MDQTTSRKRPWLAALLAALVTGLGHIYLRRWKRAFGWLTALCAASVLFVDPATLEAFANWQVTDPVAVAPILLVGCLSIADAYVLAHAENTIRRTTPAPDGQFTHCPQCGNELDADLDFCHWCTTDLRESDAAFETVHDETDE